MKSVWMLFKNNHDRDHVYPSNLNIEITLMVKDECFNLLC